mmetsp:Transcript_12342/g.34819  ORF Transcript_12342/g.34819 Transcript_12342/m.34819 type:complete len:474 (-) Transcript_12342:1981-3402(-)
MAKMMARATTVFCPPLSCFMFCVVSFPKLTLQLTPVYSSSFSAVRGFFFRGSPPTFLERVARPAPPASPPGGTFSSSLFLRGARTITSCPLPPPVSWRKTCSNSLATPRKVRSMAWSFCTSRAHTSSSILASSASWRSNRRRNSSLCSANPAYWSSAFLFRWLKSFSWPRSLSWALRSCFLLHARYMLKASEGREPRPRILPSRSCRRCSSSCRSEPKRSVARASSCRSAWAASSWPLRSSTRACSALSALEASSASCSSRTFCSRERSTWRWADSSSACLRWSSAASNWAVPTAARRPSISSFCFSKFAERRVSSSFWEVSIFMCSVCAATRASLERWASRCMAWSSSCSAWLRELVRGVPSCASRAAISTSRAAMPSRIFSAALSSACRLCLAAAPLSRRSPSSPRIPFTPFCSFDTWASLCWMSPSFCAIVCSITSLLSFCSRCCCRSSRSRACPSRTARPFSTLEPLSS